MPRPPRNPIDATAGGGAGSNATATAAGDAVHGNITVTTGLNPNTNSPLVIVRLPDAPLAGVHTVIHQTSAPPAAASSTPNPGGFVIHTRTAPVEFTVYTFTYQVQ